MPMLQSPPGAQAVIDGRRYDYFAGCGYLGLQGHPRVVEAIRDAALTFGVSAATSRGGVGDCPAVLDVERCAARFLRCESAFYFASGYSAASVAVQGLGLTEGPVDRPVLVDEHAHYSVFDAARLVSHDVKTFRHGDAGDLRIQVRRECDARPFGELPPIVLTDGLFAALGSIAPVEAYIDVLSAYDGATLLVDDAHGLATLGAFGHGTYEHGGIDTTQVNSGDTAGVRCVRVGTASKAIGGYGGLIAGSSAFIERVSNAPQFRGMTPPPAPVAAATAEAFAVIGDDPALITHLQDNARHLRAGLRGIGLDVEDSPSPVVCLALPTAKATRDVHRALADRGYMIGYMSSYSGLGDVGALRIAVFATHERDKIDALVECLGALL